MDIRYVIRFNHDTYWCGYNTISNSIIKANMYKKKDQAIKWLKNLMFHKSNYSSLKNLDFAEILKVSVYEDTRMAEITILETISAVC